MLFLFLSLFKQNVKHLKKDKNITQILHLVLLTLDIGSQFQQKTVKMGRLIGSIVCLPI